MMFFVCHTACCDLENTVCGMEKLEQKQGFCRPQQPIMLFKNRHLARATRTKFIGNPSSTVFFNAKKTV